MNLKKGLLLLVFCVLLFFISETANYLSDPASASSASLNSFFIRSARSNAKKENFDKAISNLSMASRINIFGEYDPYRDLLPNDYVGLLVFPEVNELEKIFINYLANLTEDDLENSEDQGLGRIYYRLALLAYENNHPELTPVLLKIAIYNNPEFASFHAELINYYFSRNMTEDVARELTYCLKFKQAKTLCEQYASDSMTINIPKDVGFLRDAVEGHYLNQ